MAHKLVYSEKAKDSEYIRVYPLWDGNWDLPEGEEPVSIEVRYLGPKGSNKYLERLGMAASAKENKKALMLAGKSESARWDIHKDTIVSNSKPGSLRAVFDADGQPVIDISAYMEHPLADSDLIAEILEIILSMGTLKSVTEEEYEEYRLARKKEGAPDQEPERERYAEDEEKN